MEIQLTGLVLVPRPLLTRLGALIPFGVLIPFLVPLGPCVRLTLVTFAYSGWPVVGAFASIIVVPIGNLR